MKILKRILLSVLVIVLVDMFASIIWFSRVTHEEKAYNLERADAAVVLMGDTNEEFTDIGKQTRHRLDYTISLYKKNLFDNILCVGGYRPSRNYSGAHKMKDYLVKHGVKEEHIVLEPNSYDTKTNLRYTAPILRKNRWYSIILISSPLHIHRLKTIFEFAHLRGRIIQFAPHSYFDGYEKYSVGEVWKQIHYEWVSYVIGSLPFKIYDPIIKHIREQE